MISVLLIVMITSRLTRTGLEEEWCFIRMIDATEGFENGKMLLKSICLVLVVNPIDFMLLQQLSMYVDKSAGERNARIFFQLYWSAISCGPRTKARDHWQAR